jgi:hypothetical protein
MSVLSVSIRVIPKTATLQSFGGIFGVHGVRVEPVDLDRHSVENEVSEQVDIFVCLARLQPRQEGDQDRKKLRFRCFHVRT